MARVKRSMMKTKRKSKILKLAKGFRNARSTKYKQAKQGVIRAGQHAFAHRRKKKREMRKTWQVKISYAVQDMTGLSYSKFIDVLTKKNVQVDRKVMADMIENDAAAFKRFLESVVDTEVSDMTVTAAEKTVKVKAEKKETKPAKKAEAKKEAPAKAAKKETSDKADDLTKVEGIGPKIAETLTNAGVATFAELAKKSSEDIQTIIADVRGSHDSETWSKQAEMAAAGDWDGLKAWQDEMDGGKA